MTKSLESFHKKSPCLSRHRGPVTVTREGGSGGLEWMIGHKIAVTFPIIRMIAMILEGSGERLDPPKKEGIL